MRALRSAGPRAAALLGAAGVGLFGGGLTAYLQGLLSANWNTIANSGAIWTVVAFAVAYALTRSHLDGAVIGGLVLVGEVVGYYGYVGGLRDIPVAHGEVLLWTVAAVWIGPLAGFAAHLARRGTAQQRVIALVAICGVVVGEGVYLLRLADVPRSGLVEIIVGGFAALAALAAIPAAARARVAAIGAGVVIAASVYVLYSQPIIA